MYKFKIGDVCVGSGFTSPEHSMLNGAACRIVDVGIEKTDLIDKGTTGRWYLVEWLNGHDTFICASENYLKLRFEQPLLSTWQGFEKLAGFNPSKERNV